MGSMADEIARANDLLKQAGLELARKPSGLTLCDGSLELCPDFSELRGRIASGSLNRELLVRAARLRHGDGARTLLDATAGLGEDSFLLAAAGFEVILCELNPVIALLLEDALSRARLDEALRGPASRMTVHVGDSIALLRSSDVAPDVVYLDPMFPERTKSAAVKKKFQLIHKLERPCPDESALLEAAIFARPEKVVIKRPLKGPWLGGVKPSHSLRGKAVRYDVIACGRFSLDSS